MPERQHEHGPYYWNADSPHCNHGPDPDWNTNPEAHDLWADKHPISDDGRICLDAPAGEACLECSAEEGDMVPWSACRDRDHRRHRHDQHPGHRPDARPASSTGSDAGACSTGSDAAHPDGHHRRPDAAHRDERPWPGHHPATGGCPCRTG